MINFIERCFYVLCIIFNELIIKFISGYFLNVKLKILVSAVQSRPRAPFQSHLSRWLFSYPLLTGLNCRHDVEALEECKQSGGLFTDDRRSLVGLPRSDSDYRKPYINPTPSKFPAPISLALTDGPTASVVTTAS